MMHYKSRWSSLLVLAVSALLAASACAAPPASPTTSTSKPAATAVAPTAGAAASPTTAPTKPPAQTPAPTAATRTPVTLKWGTAASMTDAAINLAEAKGYFKEEGITLDPVRIQSLAEAMPILAKGDLAYATGGWTPGIPNAVKSGIPVKVIADNGQHLPGFRWMSLIVRKDLYDSGKVRSVADLKGQKIAVAAIQTQSRYFAPLLAQANLKLDDVEFVALNNADAVVALANKSVAATLFAEPFVTDSVAKGLAVRVISASDFRPGFQATIVVGSPQFVANKDLANRWMVAYVKGIRSYIEAVKTGKGVDELITVMANNTNVKDRSSYDAMLKENSMVGFDPNGYVNKESLAADMKHFIEMGYMQEDVDINSIVDNSLADYAVQKLGKQ